MEQTPSRIEEAEVALSACIARTTAWDTSCEEAASHLALMMAESGVQRREMRRRLRVLGLSRHGARRLISKARRVVRDRETARENRDLAGATPVCPHCLQPLTPLDHFCPKCRGPVSAHASIDPLGRVYSAGRAYQRAMSGKPRLVVLVGMWLIFGPAIPFLFFLLYLILRGMGVLGTQDRWTYVQSDVLALDLLKLVLVCALIVLNSAILWKMTARWVRSRHGPLGTDTETVSPGEKTDDRAE